MDSFTKEDLNEALRAINSLISKCEKAQEKLSQGYVSVDVTQK
jgi:hypothetical protein